ncbi:hypothetical protein [Peribacillus simplex]|uniref:hypothetical protein n=1 Tax=Peribacillus simplex TaxID=1478 RepID=UPI0021A9D50C|nr:hypothetical protein [Peribacillus simplex]
MSKLDFQANSAQMMAQTKLLLRQGQMIQQGFQQHFQSAVSTNEKLTISKQAQMRINERNIAIPPQTWNQIRQKIWA